MIIDLSIYRINRPAFLGKWLAPAFHVQISTQRLYFDSGVPWFYTIPLGEFPDITLN